MRPKTIDTIVTSSTGTRSGRARGAAAGAYCRLCRPSPSYRVLSSAASRSPRASFSVRKRPPTNACTATRLQWCYVALQGHIHLELGLAMSCFALELTGRTRDAHVDAIHDREVRRGIASRVGTTTKIPRRREPETICASIPLPPERGARPPIPAPQQASHHKPASPMRHLRAMRCHPFLGGRGGLGRVQAAAECGTARAACATEGNRARDSRGRECCCGSVPGGAGGRRFAVAACGIFGRWPGRWKLLALYLLRAESEHATAR